MKAKEGAAASTGAFNGLLSGQSFVFFFLPSLTCLLQERSCLPL